MWPGTLGIIGLGAVGGSVARQAARAGVDRIVGHALHPGNGVAAVRAGAVTELVHDLKRLARTCDLIVLATGPRETLKLLGGLAGMVSDRACYMTDVASVKQAITRRAHDLELDHVFAGSDPLIELSVGEFAAARTDAFTGRPVYVTSLPAGETAAREVADFWQRVMGAHPVIMDAANHDRLAAWTRHLPQAVAAALAAAYAADGPSGVTYGSEALSATELANRRLDGLAEVLTMNETAVREAIDALDRSLASLRTALTGPDERAVRVWLDAATRWRSGRAV